MQIMKCMKCQILFSRKSKKIKISWVCRLLNLRLAWSVLTLVLLNPEAKWSGSALFAIKYVNSYQQSNPIGWKLEVGVAS